MVGDAGDERGVADVGVAAAAEIAGAVALAERDQNAIALFEVLYFFAGLLDHAAELMPHDHRHRRSKADPRPIARPQMPIGTADAFRSGLDDGAIGRTLRIGHVPDYQRFANAFHYSSFHRVLLEASPASGLGSVQKKVVVPSTSFRPGASPAAQGRSCAVDLRQPASRPQTHGRATDHRGRSFV